MPVFVHNHVRIFGVVHAPFAEVEPGRSGSEVKRALVCTTVGIDIHGDRVVHHSAVPQTGHALLPFINVVEHVNHFKFGIGTAKLRIRTGQYRYGDAGRIEFLNHRCGIGEGKSNPVPRQLNISLSAKRVKHRRVSVVRVHVDATIRDVSHREGVGSEDVRGHGRIQPSNEV